MRNRSIKKADACVFPGVRFRSKADMCIARRHVRFTPNSDRESGLSQKVRSALPLKADMCGFDACRHGGMTELEEAALTEGQGRALPGHKSAATRKRHAHRLANVQSTSVQKDCSRCSE